MDVVCVFWANYIELCNSVEKSPSAVAVEIGLSDAAPTGWKKGAKPRQSVLIRLADYFGVTVDYLLRDNEKAAPEGGVGVTERQRLVLDLFDRLTEAQQDFVIAQLQGLAQSLPSRDDR